jgi:hypothetical protein
VLSTELSMLEVRSVALTCRARPSSVATAAVLEDTWE